MGTYFLLKYAYNVRDWVQGLWKCHWSVSLSVSTGLTQRRHDF